VWVLVASGIALVVPLASVPVVAVAPWAVRWAMLPAIAGLGLPLLAASRERAARWALAWLGWAALATALAPQPVVAFWGEYRVGTGLVFLAAVAGAWAIGARAGAAAARPVATALLVGCTVNAAIAVVAQLTDLTAFGVAPLEGRAVGLYGNPVYLAELLTGGLWLAVHRVDRRAGVASAVLIAAAIELSGSRAAFALMIGVALVAVWKLPRRWVAAGAVAAGIALGAAVAAVAPGTTTGTDRVSTVAVADSGLAPRAGTWAGGLSALHSRPLWGWGPGGTLAAAGPRRTLAVARAEGPDIMFADAHDLVVESLVTTGVVGFGLLVAWMLSAVVAARRRPRGEGLLGFAALCAAVCLVEPAHPGVAPLAALALGTAGAWAAPAARRRVGAAVTAVAGLAVTAWLIAGLVALHEADLAGSPAAAQSAARRLPAWGEPDALVGRLIGFESITRRDARLLDDAIGWWQSAAARDRANPASWDDLGAALEHAGRLPDAGAAYRHALADNPWSARALNAVVRTGAAGGFSPADVAAARAKLARLR